MRVTIHNPLGCETPTAAAALRVAKPQQGELRGATPHSRRSLFRESSPWLALLSIEPIQTVSLTVTPISVNVTSLHFLQTWLSFLYYLYKDFCFPRIICGQGSLLYPHYIHIIFSCYFFLCCIHQSRQVNISRFYFFNVDWLVYLFYGYSFHVFFFLFKHAFVSIQNSISRVGKI